MFMLLNNSMQLTSNTQNFQVMNYQDIKIDYMIQAKVERVQELHLLRDL